MQIKTKDREFKKILKQYSAKKIIYMHCDSKINLTSKQLGKVIETKKEVIGMRERVYEYIKKFGSITTWEAFRDLGCSRLSEYIRQLRLEYNIDDEWVQTTNRFGEKVQYKKYYFRKEN